MNLLHNSPQAKAALAAAERARRDRLARDTRVAEKKYKELGGNFTVIFRLGEGHFLAGARDPKPVVDFIIGKTN